MSGDTALLFAERSTWEAKTVYLILSSASAFFFTTIFTINLVYQVQVAHLNPLQLVLVGTVLEITVFLTQVPTGVLADVYSRRLAVMVGLALIGAGALLEGSIPQFWAILLSQVLWGVGVTFTDGADSAWIADEVGDAQLGPLMLRSSQVSRVFSLVAIPLSVALASVRLNLPVLLGGGLFVALAAFGGTWLQARLDKRHSKQERSRRIVVGITFMLAGICILQSFIWLQGFIFPLIIALTGHMLAGFGIGLAEPASGTIILAYSPDGEEGSISSSMQIMDLLLPAVSLGLGGALVSIGRTDSLQLSIGIAAALGLHLLLVILSLFTSYYLLRIDKWSMV
jgi:MFS family permease